VGTVLLCASLGSTITTSRIASLARAIRVPSASASAPESSAV